MLNDKKLSVIRGYEARIKQLRKRLELYEPSGRFESNSSESESTELATGQMCYRCQQQRLFQLKSVECQTESKPQSFTTASSQTEPKPMWQSREIQTDFDPLIIASPSGLDGIIPHGHNDDSNSDCRSSISVDSAFCDDQMLPATSDTQIAPAPPAPPPPPMPLTLGRKVGFQLPTTDASRKLAK